MNNVEVAGNYARTMIGREMRGPNDLGPAMNRLEQKYGLPFWSLDHLRKGKAKTVESGLFQRIRSAYFAHCERQIKVLQHEMRIEKVVGHDVDENLLAEAEALLAKIAAQKKV